MYEVEGLEVLLVLAVKGLVSLPEPGERWLVLGGEPMVEVDEAVVLLDEGVEGVGEVAQQFGVIECLLAYGR